MERGTGLRSCTDEYVVPVVVRYVLRLRVLTHDAVAALKGLLFGLNTTEMIDFDKFEEQFYK